MTSVFHFLEFAKLKLWFPQSRWSLFFQFKDSWRRTIKYLLYLTVIGGIAFATLPVLLKIINGWHIELSYWSRFSQGLVSSFLETLLSLFITLVIFTVIIYVYNHTRTSSISTRILVPPKLKATLWILCLLFLFLVLSPLIIALFQTNVSLFSKSFWLEYSLQLLVSFLIVLPFIALWWLVMEPQPLNETLEAWEAEVVEEETVEITHERYSFFKWIEKDEITGYYELRESKYNGLHPEVIALIQKERDRLKIKEQENEKVEKLEELLTQKSYHAE